MRITRRQIRQLIREVSDASFGSPVLLSGGPDPGKKMLELPSGNRYVIDDEGSRTLMHMHRIDGNTLVVYQGDVEVSYDLSRRHAHGDALMIPNIDGGSPLKLRKV